MPKIKCSECNHIADSQAFTNLHGGDQACPKCEHIGKTHSYVKEVNWGGEGLPPVGFTCVFAHELEKGYEYLRESLGWENGDTLEVVYAVEGVVIVLNTAGDVLSSVQILDPAIFKPLQTEEEKETNL